MRRLRALVLAAGYGERLRPLTDDLPKPLLPVLGRPAIARTLDALAAAGCEAAAVNLHHLGAVVRTALGESHAGMALVYSEERPRILGTLGALGPLRRFLGAADLVVVVNGDTLCEWPFERLFKFHQRGGSPATLLLTSRPDPGEYGGGVGVDRRGRVIDFGREGRRLPGAAAGRVARRRVFAGAHLLDPVLLGRVPEGPADVIRDLYEPLLEAGEPIRTVTTARRWHDLGTPGRYLAAVLEWARAERPRDFTPGRPGWVAAGARIEAGARVEGSVLERGAVVETGARVRRCLVLPEARVARGTALDEAIVSPTTILAARPGRTSGPPS